MKRTQETDPRLRASYQLARTLYAPQHDVEVELVSGFLAVRTAYGHPLALFVTTDVGEEKAIAALEAGLRSLLGAPS